MAHRNQVSADAVVAYHEAGHAVACFNQAVRLRSVSIEPDEDSAGRAISRDPLRGVNLDAGLSPERTQLLVERYVRVCLAGAAAQRRFSAPSYRRYHDADDQKIAQGLLWKIVGSRDEMLAYHSLLTIQTEQLVRNVWWSEIRMLAKELVKKRALSPRDARRVIALAD